MENFFILFANCIPVKGYKRSIICDLQRQLFKFIPNSLFYLLTEEFNNIPVCQIKEKYDSKIIEEYIQFLEENEFGFWCLENEKNSFPGLSLEWDFPAKISNAIIDIRNKEHDFDKIFQELQILGCKYVQLRFYKKIDFSLIEKILDKLNGSIIKSLQILLPQSGAINFEELQKLTGKYNRISSIIVTGAPENKIRKKENNEDAYIVFINKEFKSCDSCGVIDPKRFSPNIKLFTEAQKYNTCLNRKISVDENGEIKNCPSSLISYGNVDVISLFDAVKQPEFRTNWNINKDSIEVCKDCEFRYICTDCRIYIENSNNKYSKPRKCTYDPYTAIFKN